MSGPEVSALLPPLKPPVITWPSVGPTAEPTATPAAVVALWARRPGCRGSAAGEPTADGGAGAGGWAAGAVLGAVLISGADWLEGPCGRYGFAFHAASQLHWGPASKSVRLGEDPSSFRRGRVHQRTKSRSEMKTYKTKYNQNTDHLAKDWKDIKIWVILWWHLQNLMHMKVFIYLHPLIQTNITSSKWWHGDFFLFLIAVHLQLSQFFLIAVPYPPSVSPHPVVHYHGYFIHVPWLDPSPSFPYYSSSPPLPCGHCQFVPYFFTSGSILLVCLFCSLGSSYRWDHTVFVFHFLAYFV